MRSHQVSHHFSQRDKSLRSNHEMMLMREKYWSWQMKEHCYSQSKARRTSGEKVVDMADRSTAGHRDDSSQEPFPKCASYGFAIARRGNETGTGWNRELGNGMAKGTISTDFRPRFILPSPAVPTTRAPPQPPPALPGGHTAGGHRRAPRGRPPASSGGTSRAPAPAQGGGSRRPPRRSPPGRRQKVVTQGDGGGRAAAKTGPAAPERPPQRSPTPPPLPFRARRRPPVTQLPRTGPAPAGGWCASGWGGSPRPRTAATGALRRPLALTARGAAAAWGMGGAGDDDRGTTAAPPQQGWARHRSPHHPQPRCRLTSSGAACAQPPAPGGAHRPWSSAEAGAGWGAAAAPAVGAGPPGGGRDGGRAGARERLQTTSRQRGRGAARRRQRPPVCRRHGRAGGGGGESARGNGLARAGSACDRPRQSEGSVCKVPARLRGAGGGDRPGVWGESAHRRARPTRAQSLHAVVSARGWLGWETPTTLPVRRRVGAPQPPSATAPASPSLEQALSPSHLPGAGPADPTGTLSASGGPRLGLAELAEGPAGGNGPGERRCRLTVPGGLSAGGQESRDR